DCPRKKNGTTTNTAPTMADSDYYGQVQSGGDRPVRHTPLPRIYVNIRSVRCVATVDT
ncbi:hypothetical protein FOZ61_003661, partial [Perkinsus olseni]